MTTDPFENVLRPVAGEYQEISRATYVEFISVRRYTVSPALCREGPSVERSLRRVAFGKGRFIRAQDNNVGATSLSPPTLPSNNYRSPSQGSSISQQRIPTQDSHALTSNVGASSLFRTQDAPVGISGLVWHDVDGTGERDSSDPALGEWQVFVDIDDSRDISGADLSTYTGTGMESPHYQELGTYVIEDVPTNPITVDGQTYSPPWRVRLVLPEAPPGKTWRISHPVAGHYLIDPSEEVAFNGLDFGVTLVEPSSSGCVGTCAVDLAIILDDSASMGPVIDTVKTGIRGVVDILQDAIGLNFRLALVTFKDAVAWRCGFYTDWGESICGEAAINLLQNNLNEISADGGGDLPEWSARALKFAVEGGVGAWRDSAARVALVVTDALNKPESGVTVSEAAQVAVDAGIQVLYAATPPRDPAMVDEGQLYAETTGGIFVETDNAGSNLPELLTSYIYSLCSRQAPTRICEGGVDEIFNGHFNAGIGGWSVNNMPVSWSPDRQAMLIGSGGDARQTIENLEPGDRVVLFANIIGKDPGDFDYGFVANTRTESIGAGEEIQVTQAIDVPGTGQVTIRFGSNLPATPPPSTPPCDPPMGSYLGSGSVSGTVWRDLDNDGIRQPGEPGMEGIWVYWDVNDSCSIGLLEHANTTDADGNYTIHGLPEGHLKIRVLRPPGLYVTSSGNLDHCDQPYYSVCLEDGEAIDGLDFGLGDTLPPNAASFYVESAVACVYRSDACGPGSSNAVRNANFAEGVDYWTDENGTALPATDPVVWDSLIQALVIDISEYDEVRTTLDVLAGVSYLLAFDVVSSQPDVIQEMSIQYGILDSDGHVVVEADKTNSQLGELPHTVTLPFTAPVDGAAKIFIRAGSIGGVTKIKNVLVCDPTGLCEPGSTRLTFDDFSTGFDGWGGGVWEDQAIRLSAGPGGGILSSSKQFTDLEPGSLVQVSLDLKTEAYADLRLISDGRIDQKVIGPTPGRYHHQAVVRSDGMIRFAVGISGANYTSEINRVRLVFDNVLVCVTESISCEDNVRDLRAFVRWQGVPRHPMNLFNSFVRYTTRDLVSLETTEYTYASTIEQRAATHSCDFWRQQGVAGELQDDILRAGLNPNVIDDIGNGELADVSSKANWLWSIPLGESGDSDQLIVHYPPPPTGLVVESVDIFLLEQYCLPSGVPTDPVLPPPLSCGLDPAQNIEIGIRYTNNFGESKEFSVDRHVNQLWQRQVDYHQHSQPWDNIASSGYGYKEQLARWDSFNFLLDAVNGNGLDQCTVPVETDQTAMSANLELARVGMDGVGFFLDELDLPFVDPGPYVYSLPEGRVDPVCQSESILHRPGPDDGVPPSEGPCCTPDDIPAEIDQAHRWRFERDLFDPYQPGCEGPLTVRDLALRKGLDINQYCPYVVNRNEGTLSHAMYTQIIRGRQTVLLVENEINTSRSLTYIRDRILNT